MTCCRSSSDWGNQGRLVICWWYRLLRFVIVFNMKYVQLNQSVNLLVGFFLNDRSDELTLCSSRQCKPSKTFLNWVSVDNCWVLNNYSLCQLRCLIEDLVWNMHFSGKLEWNIKYCIINNSSWSCLTSVVTVLNAIRIRKMKLLIITIPRYKCKKNKWCDVSNCACGIPWNAQILDLLLSLLEGI